MLFGSWYSLAFHLQIIQWNPCVVVGAGHLLMLVDSISKCYLMLHTVVAVRKWKKNHSRACINITFFGFCCKNIPSSLHGQYKAINICKLFHILSYVSFNVVESQPPNLTPVLLWWYMAVINLRSNVLGYVHPFTKSKILA